MTAESILAKLVSFPVLGGQSNLSIINYIKDYIESFNIVTTLVSNKQGNKASLHCRIGPAIDGGVILGANAFNVDRSISREGYLPSFDKETCINCTKCDTTCPDDCFVWEEVEGRRGRMEMTLQGIDYNFCKGCLRCVVACPTGALQTQVEERNYANENTTKKVFDFIK